MPAQPTIFVSHGGPTIVIEDTPARDHLRELAQTLPVRPKAIIIASAHFETEGAAVVSDPAPGMIYDFGGFPQELYEMVYQAPGDPALAERVKTMLEENGIETRLVDQRGYDHGTWTTMKLAFPEADIPIVQVSIDPSRDAEYHYKLGAALAPLREEGVLLVGSGHITHNLRAVFNAMRGTATVDPEMAGKVSAFTEWFARTLESDDKEAVLHWDSRAPFVKDNHPSDEHLMPIFFAYGAAGPDAHATRIHDSRQFGFFAFDCYRFD